MDSIESKKAAVTAQAIYGDIISNVRSGQPLSEAMTREFNVLIGKPFVPIQIRATISHMVGRALLRRKPDLTPRIHQLFSLHPLPNKC